MADRKLRKPRARFGLRTMRERTQSCGGSLTVRTGEAGGVEVLVRLPWPAAPAEGAAR